MIATPGEALLVSWLLCLAPASATKQQLRLYHSMVHWLAMIALSMHAGLSTSSGTLVSLQGKAPPKRSSARHVLRSVRSLIIDTSVLVPWRTNHTLCRRDMSGRLRMSVRLIPCMPLLELPVMLPLH